MIYEAAKVVIVVQISKWHALPKNTIGRSLDNLNEIYDSCESSDMCAFLEISLGGKRLASK